VRFARSTLRAPGGGTFTVGASFFSTGSEYSLFQLSGCCDVSCDVGRRFLDAVRSPGPGSAEAERCGSFGGALPLLSASAAGEGAKIDTAAGAAAGAAAVLAIGVVPNMDGAAPVFVVSSALILAPLSSLSPAVFFPNGALAANDKTDPAADGVSSLADADGVPGLPQAIMEDESSFLRLFPPIGPWPPVLPKRLDASSRSSSLVTTSLFFFGTAAAPAAEAGEEAKMDGFVGSPKMESEGANMEGKPSSLFSSLMRVPKILVRFGAAPPSAGSSFSSFFALFEEPNIEFSSFFALFEEPNIEFSSVFLGAPKIEFSFGSPLSSFFVGAPKMELVASALGAPKIDAAEAFASLLGAPKIDAAASVASLLGAPKIDEEVAFPSLLGAPNIDAATAFPSLLGAPKIDDVLSSFLAAVDPKMDSLAWGAAPKMDPAVPEVPKMDPVPDGARPIPEEEAAAPSAAPGPRSPPPSPSSSSSISFSSPHASAFAYSFFESSPYCSHTFAYSPISLPLYFAINFSTESSFFGFLFRYTASICTFQKPSFVSTTTRSGFFSSFSSFSSSSTPHLPFLLAQHGVVIGFAFLLFSSSSRFSSSTFLLSASLMAALLRNRPCASRRMSPDFFVFGLRTSSFAGGLTFFPITLLLSTLDLTLLDSSVARPSLIVPFSEASFDDELFRPKRGWDIGASSPENGFRASSTSMRDDAASASPTTVALPPFFNIVDDDPASSSSVRCCSAYGSSILVRCVNICTGCFPTCLHKAPNTRSSLAEFRSTYCFVSCCSSAGT